MANTVQGRCLCGDISYEITGNIGIFQYCHCSRCRKFTGSVHCANLFVGLDQFRWLSGEGQLGTFQPADTKHFATAFCKQCGSSMPWHTKSGKAVVVPAGSLDEHPGITPQQNVFFASRAPWYTPASELPAYDELPPRKA